MDFETDRLCGACDSGPHVEERRTDEARGNCLIEEARRRGLDIADIVDAANTYAVFVWGPSGIKLEYVEHKPTFSLV